MKIHEVPLSVDATFLPFCPNHFLILCGQHVQPALQNGNPPCEYAANSKFFVKKPKARPFHGKGPPLMTLGGSPLGPYKCKLVEPTVTYIQIFYFKCISQNT